ncbi:hypothetical protein V866_002991 [Kwoniella sp. B9012]
MGNTSTKPANNSVYLPYAPTDPYPAYIPPKKKNLLDKLDDKLEDIGRSHDNNQYPNNGYDHGGPGGSSMNYNVNPNGGNPYVNGMNGYGNQGYNYPSIHAPNTKYETYKERKKRKRREKAEIIGAMGEVGGALASIGDSGSGGSSGDGGGGGSAGCGGGGGGGSS